MMDFVWGLSMSTEDCIFRFVLLGEYELENCSELQVA